MKSNQYWKNRSAKRMYEYHTEADRVADDIAQAYIDSTNYINNEIEKIFRTFQIEGGLTESEARELLNNTPGQVKLANLKEYIKQIKDPKKQQTLLNMINSPAYSYRIKRFERLQEDIDRQTRELAEFEQKTTKNHYVQLSGEAYNRTMFDIQRGIGFGFPFSKMPVSRINEILKNNWSGQHFSARIWGRAEDINQTLKEELLTQFMTGRSCRKTAAEISDRMAVGAFEARRLVRTESTYIANSAELESYKECGIEQFRFLATLDMRTSDLCASMDGKVFPVEEGVPGTNIPPLHPWCRSTTVAVIDGAVLSDLKRRASDPETGKSYLVSADTTYEEWQKTVLHSPVRLDETQFVSKKRFSNDYSVNRNIVNSKKFHDKFEGLTSHKYANESLYQEAMKILEHRDGTDFEDVVAIDSRTGKVIVRNDTSVQSGKTGFTEEQYKEYLKHNGDIILLHNHPNGGRLSYVDISTVFNEEKIVATIAVGHDGSLHYLFNPNKKIDIDNEYKKVYNVFKEEYGDDVLADHLATSVLYKSGVFEYERL